MLEALLTLRTLVTSKVTRCLLQGFEAVHIDYGEVREQVFATIVRGDEAEAFSVIEPLDGTSCHMCYIPKQKQGGNPDTTKLSLWCVLASIAEAIRYCKTRSSSQPEVVLREPARRQSVFAGFTIGLLRLGRFAHWHVWRTVAGRVRHGYAPRRCKTGQRFACVRPGDGTVWFSVVRHADACAHG